MLVPNGGEGSRDILSIALEQSGLDSNTSCHPSFLSSETTNKFFTSLDKSSRDVFDQQTPTACSNGFGIQGVADTSYHLMVANGVGGVGVGIDFDSRMDIVPQIGVMDVEDRLTSLISSNGSDCLPSYTPTFSSVPSFAQPTVNNIYISQSNDDIDDVLEELGLTNTPVPETVSTPYSSSCSYPGMPGQVGPMDLAFTQQHSYNVQPPPAVMPYQQRPVIPP